MGQRDSKLSQEDLSMLLRCTRFDKTELQRWYKEFARDCPSMKLDQEEFKKIYRQFFPKGDSDRFASFVFGVFDANKDNSIDFKEFITALSITSRGTLDEKLDWAFRLYDINGDGFISRQEMLKIIDSIYKMVGNLVTLPADEDTPEKRVTKIFSSMDKNADDKLTYEEFREGARRDPSIVQALSLYDGLV